MSLLLKPMLCFSTFDSDRNTRYCYKVVHNDDVFVVVVPSLIHVGLCDPVNGSTCGSPVHHLTEPAQTHVHWVSDSIQPSHPLSSPSPPTSIFPSIRVFSNKSVLCIRWPKHWQHSLLSHLLFDHFQFVLIHEPNIPGSYAIFALYSIRPCFHHQSEHPQLGVVFALGLSLHSFWNVFSTDLQ